MAVRTKWSGVEYFSVHQFRPRSCHGVLLLRTWVWMEFRACASSFLATQT